MSREQSQQPRKRRPHRNIEGEVRTINLRIRSAESRLSFLRTVYQVPTDRISTELSTLLDGPELAFALCLQAYGRRMSTCVRDFAFPTNGATSFSRSGAIAAAAFLAARLEALAARLEELRASRHALVDKR